MKLPLLQCCVIFSVAWFHSAAGAALDGLWLTYRSHDPSRLVIHWLTETPGDSVVDYGTTPSNLQE